MYTQCPDCQTAFRVTAKVLQQAAGRVRCGGCGMAFNAIDHLSEDPPQSVQPTVSDHGGERAGEDAEQALLKRLDELTGPDDVRIEDTGIEWRVLDDDDPSESEDAEETGSMRWYVEDGDTESAPADADAAVPEIVDSVSPQAAADGDATASNPTFAAQAPLAFEESIPAERRYDDNTPLPDDFDDDEDLVPAATLRRRADDQESVVSPGFEEAQVDLAFGEPDEWLDLLDEVAGQTSSSEDTGTFTLSDEDGDSETGELPLATGHAAAATDDEPSAAAAPDGRGPMDDGGADESSGRPSDGIGTIEDDAGDFAMLLDEQIEALAADAGVESPDPEGDGSGQGLTPTADDGGGEPSALDETGGDDTPALEPADDGFEFGDSSDPSEPKMARSGIDDDDASDHAATPDDDAADGNVDYDESSDEFMQEIELAAEALGDDTAGDEPDPRTERAAAAPDDERENPDLVVPEPTEEEKTVNMQIDQELLRALEDEDFAATMTSEDGSPLVETIIMEGDFVRAAIGSRDRAAELEASGRFGEPHSLADTYVLNRNDEPRKPWLRLSGRSATAGVLLLAVALAAQYMHGARETLATYTTFNQFIGPVYRAFGSPVTPEWNVKGWEFEATNGSTDDAGQSLTISSRISNRSGQPLPYPLVHVSLTDRWEEIIGSRILEPNEYLAGNLDPRRPVVPGRNFTAVITIESPSAEATGFKLNVCYRVSPGRVRCAIEDFKD